MSYFTVKCGFREGRRISVAVRFVVRKRRDKVQVEGTSIQF